MAVRKLGGCTVAASWFSHGVRFIKKGGEIKEVGSGEGSVIDLSFMSQTS